MEEYGMKDAYAESTSCMYGSAGTCMHRTRTSHYILHAGGVSQYLQHVFRAFPRLHVGNHPGTQVNCARRARGQICGEASFRRVIVSRNEKLLTWLRRKDTSLIICPTIIGYHAKEMPSFETPATPCFHECIVMVSQAAVPWPRCRDFSTHAMSQV